MQGLFFRSGARALAVLSLFSFLAFPLCARTITVKPELIDPFAVLPDTALPGGSATKNCLLRCSLAQIPKGQRIVHAQWVIPGDGRNPGPTSAMHVWRVLAEWGPGACHQYRMVTPAKLEWSVAGALGNSTDRATNPTASVKFKQGASYAFVNVTQDVEMWYTGAAANRGWLMTFDDAPVQAPSIQVVRTRWELRITYEPK